MNFLFPCLTPDREAALILLARERRKTRPNLAAWYSYHQSLSRAHSAHNSEPDVLLVQNSGGSHHAENIGAK